MTDIEKTMADWQAENITWEVAFDTLGKLHAEAMQADNLESMVACSDARRVLMNSRFTYTKIQTS